jgi:hypothetical protein
VLVAIEIQISFSPQAQPSLRIPLRIELDELNCVGGQVSKEGNKMLLYSIIMCSGQGCNLLCVEKDGKAS